MINERMRYVCTLAHCGVVEHALSMIHRPTLVFSEHQVNFDV